MSLLFLLFVGCSDSLQKETSRPEEWKVEKIPEVQEVRPQRPVKIKIRRDAQGRYSWELSGENLDEILRTDKKLKKALGGEPGQ